MMFTGLMANISVSDEAGAIEWYSTLFDRGPDASPMPGLNEWRFATEFGIQIWVDADRAGSSTVVLAASDLDALAERLSTSGIDHDGPQPGGGQRILPISDSDGNRIVFSGE
ncbi:MAG: VOC family protein [Brevibacterium sp.]